MFPTSDTLLWEALPDLTLNIAQTAALCGISVRQLGLLDSAGLCGGAGARRTPHLWPGSCPPRAGDPQSDGRRRLAAPGSAPRFRLAEALSPTPLSPPATAAAHADSSTLQPEEADAIAQSLRAFFEQTGIRATMPAGWR